MHKNCIKISVFWKTASSLLLTNMNAALTQLLTRRRILLLQGKMGRFFCRFSSFLLGVDKEVFKINFNYADEFFYCHKDRATAFRGRLDEFDEFLTEFILKNQIDAVVCFNDCRPLHEVAKTVCLTHNTDFFVFEEGYLRPDYITLEQHGINGYSQIDANKINSLPYAEDRPLYTNNRFYRLAFFSALHYLLVKIGQRHYPHYTHYRGMDIWQELGCWLLAGMRKILGYLPDKWTQFRLRRSKIPFFLVALQVHNDSQISHHSDYADVTDFIKEVLTSFAKNAPAGTKIVFKHHPLDRGHRNYRRFINELCDELGISGRAIYGTDFRLPSLIRRCAGFVTVNSTTALQAIYHKKPTKITGRALYNISPLADTQSLDEFWQNPTAPNHDFYLKFREYLIEQTQLNGSFYGRAFWELETFELKND